MTISLWLFAYSFLCLIAAELFRLLDKREATQPVAVQIIYLETGNRFCYKAARFLLGVSFLSDCVGALRTPEFQAYTLAIIVVAVFWLSVEIKALRDQRNIFEEIEARSSATPTERS